MDIGRISTLRENTRLQQRELSTKRRFVDFTLLGLSTTSLHTKTVGFAGFDPTHFLIHMGWISSTSQELLRTYVPNVFVVRTIRMETGAVLILADVGGSVQR
eukprot:10786095-Heterocapsa_arctica.AAC.1